MTLAEVASKSFLGHFLLKSYNCFLLTMLGLSWLELFPGSNMDVFSNRVLLFTC